MNVTETIGWAPKQQTRMDGRLWLVTRTDLANHRGRLKRPTSWWGSIGADWSQSKGYDEEKERSRTRFGCDDDGGSNVESRRLRLAIVSGGGGTQGVSDTRGPEDGRGGLC